MEKSFQKDELILDNALSNAKVIVVTENLEVLERLQGYLQGHVLMVQGFNEEGKALEVLKGGTFHIVVYHPDKTGDRRIRFLGMVKRLNPNIEVIYLTGMISMEERWEAITRGAFKYLPLEINKEKLLNAVEEARRQYGLNISMAGLIDNKEWRDIRLSGLGEGDGRWEKMGSWEDEKVGREKGRGERGQMGEMANGRVGEMAKDDGRKTMDDGRRGNQHPAASIKYPASEIRRQITINHPLFTKDEGQKGEDEKMRRWEDEKGERQRAEGRGQRGEGQRAEGGGRMAKGRNGEGKSAIRNPKPVPLIDSEPAPEYIRGAGSGQVQESAIRNPWLRYIPIIGLVLGLLIFFGYLIISGKGKENRGSGVKGQESGVVEQVTTAEDQGPRDKVKVESDKARGSGIDPRSTIQDAQSEVIGIYRFNDPNVNIREGYVVSEWLSVRSSPEIDDNVIAVLKKGDKVEISGSEGIWYQVYILLDKVTSGWASSYFIADMDFESGWEGVVIDEEVEVRREMEEDGSWGVSFNLGKGSEVVVLNQTGDDYIIWTSEGNWGLVLKSRIRRSGPKEVRMESKEVGKADILDIYMGAGRVVAPLKLRAGPDHYARSIAIMRKGTVVEILGVEGKWCWVLTPKGHEGWASSNFIAPLDFKPPSAARSKNHVDVHESPEKGSSVRFSLSPGQSVKVLNMREGWYMVRIPTAQWGWVPSESLFLSLPP